MDLRAHVAIADQQSAVWKNECVKCFANPRSPGGIDVCLRCFTGGCEHHAREHAAAFGHALSVNVTEVAERPPTSDKATGTEHSPPQKLTKLAIGVEGGAQLDGGVKWRQETRVRQWPTGDAAPQSPVIDSAVAALLAATDTGTKAEAAAWEKRMVPCHHTRSLAQDPRAAQAAVGSKSCSRCALKSPLWICLTCGNVACGRPLPPPMTDKGGNGHALEHRREFPDHVLVAKIGTITPEGKGDVYCYGCDDDVVDEQLAKHLAHFGMLVAQQEKTEMTMTELELERNKLLDLLSTEDGTSMVPVQGPGLTGLRNIGNTCYMNSVVQAFFGVPEVRQLFFDDVARHHVPQCRAAQPARCWLCQMGKLAHGLLSGDYCRAPDANTDAVGGGVAPRMWKQLVTAGDAVFAGVEQQDAYEFFQFLLKKVTENQRRVGGPNPAELFAFDLTHRIECLKCHGVRYKREPHTTDLQLGMPKEAAVPPMEVPPADEKAQDRMLRHYKSTIPLSASLAQFAQGDQLGDFACPHCRERTVVAKRPTLDTFPTVLVVQLRRFEFENWVPMKISARVGGLENDANGRPVVVDLSHLQTPPAPAGEMLLPEDGQQQQQQQQQAPVDAGIVAQLEGMGFPRLACERAAFETKNVSSEVAAEWLFAHMEDPLLEQPVVVAAPARGGASASPAIKPESVEALQGMGFTAALARHALRQCDGDVERAVDWLFSHPDAVPEDEAPAAAAAPPAAAGQWAAAPADAGPKRYQLFAFVVHKGNTIGSGHYVVYLWSDVYDHWVLLDDERVFLSEKPPMDQAYMLLFRRVK